MKYSYYLDWIVYCNEIQVTHSEMWDVLIVFCTVKHVSLSCAMIICLHDPCNTVLQKQLAFYLICFLEGNKHVYNAAKKLILSSCIQTNLLHTQYSTNYKQTVYRYIEKA